VLRAIVILLACAAAVVWIEPQWSKADRVLTLRVRRSDELVSFVRAQSRELGRSAVDALREELETPPVGSGSSERSAAPASRAPAAATRARSLEGITHNEQLALDRLVEESTREP
jgi:hypothetical protein